MNHGLTKQQHLDLYYYMALNRAVEETLELLFAQNKVISSLYPSLGQEAISVGTAYALGREDWIAPMIRNIGSLLVRGVPPRDIFTQHMGTVTSPTQGKDRTSYFGDLKQRHIVSAISMLGELIPVMVGVAMGGRYLGHKTVTMTWIGDGGSSTGPFHEGLNLAAVQRAPFVLILENNQFAYSTPVGRQVPLRDFADRAKAYGIQQHDCGWQRCGGRVHEIARGCGAGSRRRRPRPYRSQDHAHEGPRAARSRGICAEGDDRILEGARSDCALREVPHRKETMG